MSRQKLFVGNLPADTTEQQLRQVFEPFGEVREVHIMSSARSRLGYACAFVVYAASGKTDEAVDRLNGQFRLKPTDSEPISVSYARQEEPKKARAAEQDPWAQQQAAFYSNPYAAQQYYQAQLALMAQWTQTGYPMMAGMAGFGMPGADYGSFGLGESSDNTYEESSQALAMAAFASQAGMPSFQGGGAAAPQTTADESKLFIGGLPSGVTEAEIRTVFSQVGTVKEVHIMQGKSQSGQACAFVLYPDQYSAQLAIRTLNKTPWHSAPDAPPIIVRTADKVQKKKGGSAKEVNPAMLRQGKE